MELAYGTVVTHMPPGGKHGKRASRINRALDEFAERSGQFDATLETGYLLRADPDLVRGPDVALIRVGRLPGGELPAEWVPVPPDLAVEVVSPNDLQGEVLEKVGEYLDAGVPRVWVVYERTRTVVVYFGNQEQAILTEEDTLGPRELGIDGADFSLHVAQIFR